MVFTKISQRFTNAQLKFMAAVVVAAAMIAPMLSASAASADAQNNILWNGCSTLSACKTAMTNGDGHNSASNITKIYNYFGISTSNISSMAPVSVTSSGQVIASENIGTFKKGAVIATNAQSVGREDIDGNQSHYISSIGVWERPTSVAFVSGSLGGWALMENGKFKAFILSSCGNAGTATPATPPATPKPTPSSTPKPTPKPSSIPGTAVCVGLLPTKENGSSNVYEFTIHSQVSGSATIKGYIFTVNNGSGSKALPEQTSNVLQGQTVPTGTSFSVWGQVVSTGGTTNLTSVCSAQVGTSVTPSPAPTLTPTPSPSPSPSGQVLGASTSSLPATGPESALGGAVGLTGIGVAGRAYLRSRKSLLASLRRKR